MAEGEAGTEAATKLSDWRENKLNQEPIGDVVLQVKGLTGGYSPRRPVLHELDFTVRAGEMMGLIGLNGAGKSTTVKHLLGLMTPHRGEIIISGTTLQQNAEKYRGSYAYVPEVPVLFEELTVEEHLRLTAMAYGIGEQDYAERSEQLLAEFRMTPKKTASAAHLSKGMKQKVMLMNALLARPALYIIDEPFLGLDPLGIRSLLERLMQERSRGAAILMSTHILSTVEAYCDRFILLHGGKIREMGTMEQVRTARGQDGDSLEEIFYRVVEESDADGKGA
ncbi:ABC transporter ATP-binding protein [Paenibacillus pasadenensis]|uniref:ABC transporter ATP-binding protein n=1 Tax=Paenibacillus pasadenensis TaxID=217090 RepID=UPI002042419F|nr:ABC transporter ATP-binding protein [Paenibacillus pasadenensis]MCM3746843.1 ABC transporter ATP-binding protein [Paenibacillus pasadenensis]